jgi:phospholipase D1/2
VPLTTAAIELSEHFVYIENQFFITSTVVDGVRIENGVGDALVDRIIRAHREGTPWKACIVIPLLPGYTYPIDSNEASSVRLILECQNRTISRGTHSIFSRLRKEGIDVSGVKVTCPVRAAPANHATPLA